MPFDVVVEDPAHGPGFLFGTGAPLRVIPEHEGRSGIALVPLEHRTEVDEAQVVLAQHRIRRGRFLPSEPRVLAYADEVRVPAALAAEFVQHLAGDQTAPVRSLAGALMRCPPPGARAGG